MADDIKRIFRCYNCETLNTNLVCGTVCTCCFKPVWEACVLRHQAEQKRHETKQETDPLLFDL
jgi:hypothetical protein